MDMNLNSNLNSYGDILSFIVDIGHFFSTWSVLCRANTFTDLFEESTFGLSISHRFFKNIAF